MDASRIPLVPAALLLLPLLLGSAAAQTTLHQASGSSFGDLFGWWAARAGDSNGDGVADFVVTALQHASAGPGYARVVSGSSLVEIRTITGALPGLRFGLSAACAGDIDADGRADLAIASLSDSLSAPGTVQVFSGQDGSLLRTSTEAGGGYGFGTTLDAGGDLDGDGIPDLLVGDPRYFGPGGGSVRVLAGSDGSVILSISSPGGEPSFGSTASSVGDLDLDGIPDLAAGLDRDGAGNPCARVFSGGDGSLLWTLDGPSGSFLFGYWTRPAGDVDRDGTPDVLASDIGVAGQVRAFSGATGALLHAWGTGSPSDGFGWDMMGIGDLDRDGYGDVAIAAPQTNSVDGAGYVRLLSGRHGSAIFDVAGSSRKDNLGSFLVAAGDSTGDGIPELLVTSMQSSDGQLPTASPTGPGFARLVSLRPLGLAPYGAGTPGCDGPQSLTANLVPSVGEGGFALRSDHGPGSLGLALVTDAPSIAGIDPFGLGVTLHVDLLGATEVLALDFLDLGMGYATAPAPIPAVPALAGRTYFAQGLWVWTACTPSTFGLSTSSALAVTIHG